MSASHHGNDFSERQKDLMERFIAQAEGKAKRRFSQGRICPEDDGDLAMAVMADPTRKLVVIRFGKPTEWIGLGPDEVRSLINLLASKLAALGEPVSITIGEP